MKNFESSFFTPCPRGYSDSRAIPSMASRGLVESVKAYSCKGAQDSHSSVAETLVILSRTRCILRGWSLGMRARFPTVLRRNVCAQNNTRGIAHFSRLVHL